eukprot:6668607-Karenia_brevis.AAC.1
MLMMIMMMIVMMMMRVWARVCFFLIICGVLRRRLHRQLIGVEVRRPVARSIVELGQPAAQAVQCPSSA